MPAPEIGPVTDADSLRAALAAAGPLDNQTPDAIADDRSPGLSICAGSMTNNDPPLVVIHEAIAEIGGQFGVVLVAERSDGAREARIYGTGEADPVTGGCPLLLTADLD